MKIRGENIAEYNIVIITFQTTVLEAKDRIGGRIHDNSSLGVAVGNGAQLLNGCTNNPLIVLSHQVKKRPSKKVLMFLVTFLKNIGY
jgi:monoamine oxidase